MDDCLKCPPGRSGDKQRLACSACPAGKHKLADDDNAACRDCPSGFAQREQSQLLCLKCPDGRHAEKRSATCAPCSAGKYKLADDDNAACRDCPSGFAQREQSQLLCLKCPEGRSAFATGSASCSACSAGKFVVNEGGDSAHSCIACPAGWKSETQDAPECTQCGRGKYQNNTGQAVCFSCLPGKAQDFKGQFLCKDCAEDMYTDEMTQTACKECPEGRSAEAGKAFCPVCGKGRFSNPGNNGGICQSCPAGWFQEKEETSACTECPIGWKAYSAGSAACTKPEGVKTPEDCDQTTQYLDASDPNPQNHSCASCPLGASCNGTVTWSGVRAKFGWFRVTDAHAGNTNTSSAGIEHNEDPPACLKKQTEMAQPDCAFAECLYAPACLGAPNPSITKFQLDHDNDQSTPPINLATSLCVRSGDHFNCSALPYSAAENAESCWEDKGYQRLCFDRNNANRTRPCRLCGTCKSGYKRQGSGTKCRECPPPSTNRALLALAFLACVIGVLFLVVTTIRAESKGNGGSRSALKKILVSVKHRHALSHTHFVFPRSTNLT